MRAPDFWRGRGALSTLLLPAAFGYEAASRLRHTAVRPWRAPVPVVCVGNLVAGGAGKTPTAIAIAHKLDRMGRSAHILTRGYGGRMHGPVRVETGLNSVRDVGDEALLLAARAPTWVSRDRPAGARAAAAAGAQIIVMDDGFQNPALAKDLSLIVIDGGYGLGNGRVMPAGPLRESLDSGLARADAVVLIGEDETGLVAEIGPRRPVLRARLVPTEEAAALAGKPVLAFAGIGRPEKFFRTLAELGCQIVDAVPYPDHHVYRPDEIMRLVEMASEAGAEPVTTEKDFVRLPPEARLMVRAVPVELEWRDEAAIDGLLAGF